MPALHRMVQLLVRETDKAFFMFYFMVQIWRVIFDGELWTAGTTQAESALEMAFNLGGLDRHRQGALVYIASSAAFDGRLCVLWISRL